jgi:hypothetical protein
MTVPSRDIAGKARGWSQRNIQSARDRVRHYLAVHDRMGAPLNSPEQ